MNRIVKPAARLAALSAVIALVACTTNFISANPRFAKGPLRRYSASP